MCAGEHVVVRFSNDAHCARLPLSWLKRVAASMQDLAAPPGNFGTTALVGRLAIGACM